MSQTQCESDAASKAAARILEDFDDCVFIDVMKAPRI